MAYGSPGTTITGSPPACRVRRTTPQSVPTATETAVTFDAERYDTDTMHSTASLTSRVTFTTAGVYDVDGGVSFAANGTGLRQVGIRLNGTTYLKLVLTAVAAAGSSTILSVSTTYKFAAADYVELVVYQSSGGGLDVETAGSYSPEFAATWLGRGT
jgi:hypothetical protein